MALYQAYLLILLYISFQNPSLMQAAPNNHTGCAMAVSTSQVDFKEIRLQCAGMIRILEAQIPDEGEDNIFYRIITDGFIQVIEIFGNAGELLQCKIETDSAIITKFLTGFNDKNDSPTSDDYTNATVDSLKAQLSLPYDISADDIKEKLLNIEFHVDWCSEMLAETTLIEINNRLQSGSEIYYSTNLTGNLEVENGSRNDDSSSKRPKRFIYPGTNWCGCGNRATDLFDLGRKWRVDVCCRTHDHCHWFIGARQYKYCYFNRRRSTISHDECDRR